MHQQLQIAPKLTNSSGTCRVSLMIGLPERPSAKMAWVSEREQNGGRCYGSQSPRRVLLPEKYNNWLYLRIDRARDLSKSTKAFRVRISFRSLNL